MHLNFRMHKFFSPCFKNINSISRGAKRVNSLYVVTQGVPSKTAGKIGIFVLQCTHSHAKDPRMLDLAYHNLHK